jgi:hypothetical protein
MDRKKIISRVLLKLSEKEKSNEYSILKEGFSILDEYAELNKKLQVHLTKIKKEKKDRPQ